jgi:hypothetical protein
MAESKVSQSELIPGLRRDFTQRNTSLLDLNHPHGSMHGPVCRQQTDLAEIPPRDSRFPVPSTGSFTGTMLQ